MFWVIGIIFVITEPTEYTRNDWLGYIFMIAVSFYFWKKSNKAMMKNKDLIKKIINGKMYLVECYVYDKKHNRTQDTDGTVYENYYIKITDNHYVVEPWIEIPKTCYRDEENYMVRFFVLNEKGIDIFEIDTTTYE